MLDLSASDPTLLAQAQPASAWGGTLFIFIAFAAIFYFLLYLPGQRQRKKHAQMVSALKNGDKVITNGGIYGTVVGLEPEAVQLRVAEQVKIKVARTAIAGLQQQETKGS